MTPLPWVQLLQLEKDWWVDVYGPLDKEQLTLKPGVITLLYLRVKSERFGVSTSLDVIDSCPVLLNRLYLCHDRSASPLHKKQREKHRVHLDHPDPNGFLRRICLQFSDIMVIYSHTIPQADQEIATWAACQKNDSFRTIPKFLILQDQSQHRKYRCALSVYLYSEDMLRRTALPHEEVISQSEISPLMWLSRTIKQEIDTRKERRHLWNLKTLVYLWEKTCEVVARTDRAKVNFAMMLRESYWPGNTASVNTLYSVIGFT
jgi:hypothetical protein